jgi:hypothetical protein
VLASTTDQDLNPDYNEIGQWANFLPSLVAEDNRRIGNLMRKMTPQTPSSKCLYLKKKPLNVITFDQTKSGSIKRKIPGIFLK